VSDPLESHYRVVLRALADGRVVPLLGAGVNRCGRPSGTGWGPGRYLPDGGELARHLASYAGYPDRDPEDLVRVSQYVAVMLGAGPLYDVLHELFDADYPPTPVHRFLAELPGHLRRRGLPAHHQLIITTNYDDALERALQDAGREFDLVTYLAVGEHTGRFVHYPPQGEPVLIERPNEYRALALDQRTVVLKLHGAVDRENADHDSYVITEDHYIDYLTRTELSGLLPVTLAAKLRRGHFLFLGYSLRDWNLRVILHRIWGEQRLRYRSWAVQLHPEDFDRRFWEARHVDIYDIALEEYVRALRDRISELPRAPAP
jgi:SIR2-like protein